MFRLPIFAVFAAVLFGQTAQKPAEPQAPPKVDLALRARVTEFLNYHVTGEFRKAEALVARDSKDIFYNRAKPRYMGCKGISSIRYSEHFTKAYVTAFCTLPVVIQPSDNELQADGTPQVPVGAPTVPLPSMWKLERGKWCWYIDKELDRRSPFGIMPTMPTGQPTAPGAVLPMVSLPPGMTAPAPPQETPMDPGIEAAIRAVHVPVTAASIGKVSEEALHHVKLEPATVTMKAGASAKVKISNDAGDARQLMLLGGLAGIDAKLDSAVVKGGESTTLNLKASEAAKSATLNVVVVTTGEMLPLAITIQ